MAQDYTLVVDGLWSNGMVVSGPEQQSDGFHTVTRIPLQITDQNGALVSVPNVPQYIELDWVTDHWPSPLEWFMWAAVALAPAIVEHKNSFAGQDLEVFDITVQAKAYRPRQ